MHGTCETSAHTEESTTIDTPYTKETKHAYAKLEVYKSGLLVIQLSSHRSDAKRACVQLK